MKKKEVITNYVADFETEYLTEEQIKAGAKTYVWAWQIRNADTLEIYQTGTDIKGFIKALFTLKTCNIWFHNLKYDIQFLLNYLLLNGWKQVQSNKNMKPYTFSSLVSGNNIVYSIELRTLTANILILDSYKKLPFKISKIAEDLKLDVKKGEIDYHKHREEGGQLSTEDFDYLSRDTLIPAIALKEIFFKNGFNKRTIGADCLEYFKNMQQKFYKLFPQLDKQESDFLKEALAGGVVYVNPKYAGKILEGYGEDYDDNGLYSYVSHSSSPYKLPIGYGEYFIGGYEYDKRKPFYVQHLKAAFTLKKGEFPCIHSRQKGLYLDSELITDTEGDMYELVLSCYDLKLLFTHYDVHNIELINGYKYEVGRGYFDEYINHFVEMKINAKKAGNFTEYLTAKLFLNNLIGKYGQSTESSNKVFEIKDGLLTSKPKHSVKKGLYMPIAVAVTSSARLELFKMIDANKKTFVYCDTDSCKVYGKLNKPEGVELDNYKLGAWKLENTWDKAIFLKPKTYAEHTASGWKITGAGMNDEVKQEVIKQIEEDPNNFQVGKSYNGKLKTKRVKGGVVLQEGIFTLNKI